MTERAPRWPRTALLVSALLGTGLAILLHLFEGTFSSPVSRVLALAVGAIVPLGIAALPSTGPTWDRLVAIVVFTQPPAAACVVVSLSMDAGRTAGLWSAPWMALAILCACMGLTRAFAKGALRDPRELCAAAALLYLPVGAGWLVMSRMGLRPMDFDAIIVALTAVHFHYAAFAGPILASRAIGASEGGWRKIASVAGLAIVVAMPIVAAGLTASPALALAGAVLLAVALLALSIVTLVKVQRTMKNTGARVLVTVSALVPFLSMPLAVIWSHGDVIGVHALGLERMIDLHGVANAFGLALAGLFAWVAEDRAQPEPKAARS
jgi:hypothetical protein